MQSIEISISWLGFEMLDIIDKIVPGNLISNENTIVSMNR